MKLVLHICSLRDITVKGWISLSIFAVVINDGVSRRNENVYGTKAVIGKQAAAVTGDDAKTFQATIIEYSKDQPPAKVCCLHSWWMSSFLGLC